MPEPTLYQPDFDRMYDDERQMFDGLVKYGRLVPVERPLYEIDRKAFDPYWNESHYEALASMIDAGYIKQVAGRVGIGGDDG